MPEGGRPPRSGPDPRRVHTQQELVRELDRLRRRAAHGSQRTTVSLDRLSRLTGIPRSTVHAYVSGMRLPPPDVLDVIVTGLGASAAEQRAWGDALDRVSEGPSPQSVPSAPAARETPTVPHQLPGRPTGFVGRDAELAQLDEFGRAADLDPEAARIMALTGTGGVGKTALVLTWSHRNPERSPDGQVWVDLRGFGPGAALAPGDALEEMLRAVGVNTAELPSSVDARAALFRTAVADRRMLLVLDNARDAAHVRPLLPGAPGMTTVITSRNTLRSLVVDGVARIQLKRLRRSEARSLLVAQLPAELADSPAMTRIVDRCEGLPLTLRIVRERLAGEPAAEAERIAAQFEREGRTWLDEFDLPEDAGDVSMRAALRWSYRALPEPAARAFQLLPLCLVPTIDVHCMSALLDADLRTTRRQLDALVSANLLERGDEDGYRVHDLVATFAAEILRAEMGADVVEGARMRLWRALSAIGELAVLETDRRQMRIAWPQGERPDDLEAAGRIDRAHAAAWVAKNIDGFAAATIAAIRSGRSEYGWVLAERGFRTLRWVADAGRMAVAITQATDDAHRRGAHIPAIVLTRLLGVTRGLRGEFDEAEDLFARCIELAEAAGADFHVGVDRQNRAFVWGRRGELQRAIAELAEVAKLDALTEAERIPAMLTLIDFEIQHGDIEAAGRLSHGLEARLESFHEGEAHHLSADLTAVRIAYAKGEREPLLEWLTAIEGPAVIKNNSEIVTEIRIVRATVLSDLGAQSEAEAAARDAVRFSEVIASHSARVRALRVLGIVMYRAGRSDEAIDLMSRAVDLARGSGHRYEECEALVELARVLRFDDRHAESRAAADSALGIADTSGYQLLARDARFFADEGKPT